MLDGRILLIMLLGSNSDYFASFKDAISVQDNVDATFSSREIIRSYYSESFLYYFAQHILCILMKRHAGNTFRNHFNIVAMQCRATDSNITRKSLEALAIWHRTGSETCLRPATEVPSMVQIDRIMSFLSLEMQRN